MICSSQPFSRPNPPRSHLHSYRLFSSSSRWKPFYTPSPPHWVIFFPCSCYIYPSLLCTAARWWLFQCEVYPQPPRRNQISIFQHFYCYTVNERSLLYFYLFIVSLIVPPSISPCGQGRTKLFPCSNSTHIFFTLFIVDSKWLFTTYIPFVPFNISILQVLPHSTLVLSCFQRRLLGNRWFEDIFAPSSSSIYSLPSQTVFISTLFFVVSLPFPSHLLRHISLQHISESSSWITADPYWPLRILLLIQSKVAATLIPWAFKTL